MDINLAELLKPDTSPISHRFLKMAAGSIVGFAAGVAAEHAVGSLLERRLKNKTSV